MIKYEWRDCLEPAEAVQLEDLLRRSAEHDAEAEYNTIGFADVEAALARPQPNVWHLLIWLLPHATAMGAPDESEQLAGILRLVFTTECTAQVTVVIDPKFRSIGIMTLLLERIGLNTECPDGWMGTGARTVVSWAQGNHPAAGRLGNRFFIRRTQRIWKLIRSASAEDGVVAPSLEPVSDSVLKDCGLTLIEEGANPIPANSVHAVREEDRIVGVVALDLRAAQSEEFGRCATIRRAIAGTTADEQSRRTLLEGAAALALESGLSGVIIYVDSDDAAMVNACRMAGFQHDRTDVRYQFGALQ